MELLPPPERLLHTRACAPSITCHHNHHHHNGAHHHNCPDHYALRGQEWKLLPLGSDRFVLEVSNVHAPFLPRLVRELLPPPERLLPTRACAPSITCHHHNHHHNGAHHHHYALRGQDWKLLPLGSDR